MAQAADHVIALDDSAMERALRRAIALAADPLIRPGANPRVGCVLLDSTGAVLAEGAHRGAGTPHAEADALARLPVGARVDTAVVTLEPCAHHGRTPPCAQALVQAGVRQVVYGRADPNPVAAGGAAYLRQRGVRTLTGQLINEVAALDPYWFEAVRLGRPHVTWKFAGTLDGRSAAADGSSRWITSAAARRDVHRERAGADAVLAGTGTVLRDDAQLSVRDSVGQPLPAPLQPLRVVLGEREIPTTARVLDDTAATLHLSGRSLPADLATLWDAGCRRLFLEGGPTLAASFWRAGLVDRVLCYLAPALLGAGPAAVADLGIADITGIARLEYVDVRRLGPDLRLDLRPARSAPDALLRAEPGTNTRRTVEHPSSLQKKES